MRYLTADYIVDENFRLVKNGLLIADKSGLILDFLNPEIDGEHIQDIEKSTIEVYKGLISPGFVNTHCHLELSYLKNQLTEKTGLPGFVAEVEQKKNNNSELILSSIDEAEKEMITNGIVAVGDISNTDHTIQQKEKDNVYYHTFVECYASNKAYADKAFSNSIKVLQAFKSIQSVNNNASISPHAPYSVSDVLFNKINDWIIKNNSIATIHNQESQEENELFLSGSGKLAEFIQSFGTEIKDYVLNSSAINRVINKLPADKNLQLVHNTFTSEEDIRTAENYFTNVFWCFCPNANLYIENKLPKIELFINENCKITIGTDGLASNHQLSIIEELKCINKYYPAIGINNLLKWASRNGAEFLGIEKTYGSFSKGKKPGIILLENIDLINLSFSPETRAKVLV